MTFWTTELATVAGTPFPYRSQNETWTIDNQPSENAASDCAMAAVASILEWITGIHLPIDALNDWMFYQGHVGVTPPQTIQGFLSQYCATGSTLLSPNGQVTGSGSLTNLIWSYTVTAKPLIILQQFSDTVTSLHWRSVTGIDPNVVVLGETWNGTRLAQDYATCARLYRGNLIGIERVRDSHL